MLLLLFVIHSILAQPYTTKFTVIENKNEQWRSKRVKGT